MKDREKQIKELQSILPNIELVRHMYGDVDFAEWLYDYNCRKIDEDSVVLTRKERVKLVDQVRNETLDEVYTVLWNMQFRNCGAKARLLGAILDLYEPKKSPYETILDNVRAETRKETAIEIFNALSFITYRKDGKAYIFDVKELREIAKQFGVEIGEDQK